MGTHDHGTALDLPLPPLIAVEMAERSDQNPQASMHASIVPEEPQSPDLDTGTGGAADNLDNDHHHSHSHSHSRHLHQELPLNRRSANGDAREATELEQIHRNYSRASNYELQRASSAASRPPSTLSGRFRHAVKSFWKHQVSIAVPHDTCRDHLALERTFLGYLRTSLALSMLGVLVSQLFRLQHAPAPDPTLGYYVLGKPLSCLCQGAALLTTVVGAYRAWKTQNAMVRGKAITGGLDIILLAAGVFLLLLTFFVLMIAVSVKKEHFN